MSTLKQTQNTLTFTFDSPNEARLASLRIEQAGGLDAWLATLGQPKLSKSIFDLFERSTMVAAGIQAIGSLEASKVNPADVEVLQKLIDPMLEDVQKQVNLLMAMADVASGG